MGSYKSFGEENYSSSYYKKTSDGRGSTKSTLIKHEKEIERINMVVVAGYIILAVTVAGLVIQSIYFFTSVQASFFDQVLKINNLENKISNLKSSNPYLKGI